MLKKNKKQAFVLLTLSILYYRGGIGLSKFKQYAQDHSAERNEAELNTMLH